MLQILQQIVGSVPPGFEIYEYMAVVYLAQAFIIGFCFVLVGIVTHMINKI